MAIETGISRFKFPTIVNCNYSYHIYLMVLAPKWETASTVKWYASGFAQSFTDFGLNNRLHININYPPPQIQLKI